MAGPEIVEDAHPSPTVEMLRKMAAYKAGATGY